MLRADTSSARRTRQPEVPPGMVGPFPDRRQPTRILVVEDDLLVALFIQTHLGELGVQVVGPVGHVAGALAQIRAGAVDGALLDLTLEGRPAFAVADALAAAGIPYVLVTAAAEADIPAPYAERPLLRKPFRFLDLEFCLDRYLGVR